METSLPLEPHFNSFALGPLISLGGPARIHQGVVHAFLYKYTVCILTNKGIINNSAKW